MTDFNAALEKFLSAANEIRKASGYTEDLTIETGRKNIRVVANNHGQRSAYCFVDIATGNILKSASWKVPAKGARGNIFSPDNGAKAVTPYGANYNR